MASRFVETDEKSEKHKWEQKHKKKYGLLD